MILFGVGIALSVLHQKKAEGAQVVRTRGTNWGVGGSA